VKRKKYDINSWTILPMVCQIIYEEITFQIQDKLENMNIAVGGNLATAVNLENLSVTDCGSPIDIEYEPEQF
jgi:TATA-box binding protein (TBP) (component of TFIID and TFIIIB)